MKFSKKQDEIRRTNKAKLKGGKSLTVSVAIPTYNRPNNLKILLDDLLNQTLLPNEIIVVDDSENAFTKDLVTSYLTKYRRKVKIKYIKNYKEKAITTARNVGAEKSNSEIILFLDDDFELERDFVEKIMEVFNIYPNAVGVAGYIANTVENFNYKYFYHKIMALLGFKVKLAKNSCELMEYPYPLTEIIHAKWLVRGAYAFRKEVFSEITFNEKMRGYAFYEDVLFSHLLIRKYPNSLYITPYARCYQKGADEGRRTGVYAEKQKWENYIYAIFQMNSITKNTKIRLIYHLMASTIIAAFLPIFTKKSYDDFVNRAKLLPYLINKIIKYH